MATQRISILGWNVKPDTSGEVFFEPYSIKATNDNFDHTVLVFNNSGTTDGLYGSFELPSDYVGSPQFVLVWTSTATTGNIKMDLDYRAVGGNDLESLDQATFQENLTVTDTAPSAVNERMEVNIGAPTAGNFAVDDTVEFFLTRESGNAADTMAAAVIVHALLFEYADA